MESELEDQISRMVEQMGRQALLPCLHLIQEKLGCVTPEAATLVAKKLGLSRGEVFSVASFYGMFSREREGKFVIRVCVSLPCYLKGAREILQYLQGELGVKPGQTTPDGLFTLKETSCLGFCDGAPAVMVNDKTYGRVTVDKMKEILQQCREKA